MPMIAISDWVKLGAAIRDARTSHGLTQKELATRARVSRSWLAKVESGHRGAELEQVLRLLSALGLGLFLQTAPDRREFPTINESALDGMSSIDTPSRARDSKSRQEASHALLAAHREAASKRQSSWRAGQEAMESSSIGTEGHERAEVGSA